MLFPIPRSYPVSVTRESELAVGGAILGIVVLNPVSWLYR